MPRCIYCTVYLSVLKRGISKLNTIRKNVTSSQLGPLDD